MHTTPTSAPEAPASGPTLKRVLGLPSLVAFGLTSMGILSVVAVYGAGTEISDGHLPAAYMAALIAMLFTAHSYGQMARHVPVTGGAYAYASRAFGKPVGFLVGWAMMLDYVFLPMVNFLLFGLYLNSLLPGIPPQLAVLVCLLVVGLFSVIGVAWIKKMNFVVVAASVLVILVFVVLAVLNAPDLSVQSIIRPLTLGDGGIAPVMAAAAIVAFAFLGFDGVSTLSEETRNPKRDVPRGIILSTLFAGLGYTLFSVAGSVIAPDWRSIENLDAAGTELMQRAGGDVLMVVFVVVNLAGLVLCGTAAQMSVSRVIYAMGRDRILPGGLAKLQPRFRTPYVAALLVSAISLVALFITLEQAVYMINFGALIAFAVVNLATIKVLFFELRKRGAKGTLRNLVLPLLGFASIGWLWTSLAWFTYLLGAAWLTVGLAIFFVRRRKAGGHVGLNFDDGTRVDGAAQSPEVAGSR
ncbi:APC family permease [Arthrobacter sp. AK01]|uniref:APC family permease n=1 Tax=Micrococcaceae TaxID=1268 RepID=UPI001E313198|nr:MULTISPECIES: APC family permease [Micrococcaceae]MCD4852884.1 APC family permease [Arthrobacter sp. AK01]MCP1411280.1 amino acid transporter [Paenarthrobacter sp. A20]